MVIDAIVPFVGEAAGAVTVGGEVVAGRQQAREIDVGGGTGRAGLRDPAAGGVDTDGLGSAAPGMLGLRDHFAGGRHQFFVVGQVTAGSEGALDGLRNLLPVVDTVQRQRGFFLLQTRRQRQANLLPQRVLRDSATAEARAEALLALEQYLQFTRARQFENVADEVLCLLAFHQSRPRQMRMPRKRVGAAPWVICATCIGSPLPQLVTPWARQKRSSQVASQAFQKSGVLLW